MKELYEALIEGVPAERKARLVCRGRWQSYVETEDGAGIASLLIPGKIPYRDTQILTEWAGRPLRDLASQIRRKGQERALGCAAINAWYNAPDRLGSCGASQIPPWVDEGHAFREMAAECRGKTVSVIGHFNGVRYLGEAFEVRIFEQEPHPGDLPAEREEELLPGSDVVFVTGMAFTNGTMPQILRWSAGARIFLSGPSVPMTPLWYGYGVEALFGMMVWDIPGCRKAVKSGGPRDLWKFVGKTVMTSITP